MVCGRLRLRLCKDENLSNPWSPVNHGCPFLRPCNHDYLCYLYFLAVFVSPRCPMRHCRLYSVHLLQPYITPSVSLFNLKWYIIFEIFRTSTIGTALRAVVGGGSL